MVPYSLYIHIPFCSHRCCYCDFNTYAGIEDLIPAYVEALCAEIASYKEMVEANLPVHTIFFGGGTPSLINIRQFERILVEIENSFKLLPELELSIEANPGSLSLVYLHELHKLGANRLSIGMQSTNPGELRILERHHRFNDVINSVKWARKAGFDNLNLDLIFGIPYQTLESWSRSLSLGIALEPEHLSLYALTIEHGTPLAHWVDRGLLPDTDSDLAAEMYELADQRLVEVGYFQYEISNWALQNSKGELLSCQHNLQYWRNLPYIGLGAGAHGYINGYRTANVLSPSAYIERCMGGRKSQFPFTPATANALPIDRVIEMGETMMMGLRLTKEGVSNLDFRDRFGQDLLDVFPDEIQVLLKDGLLEWASDRQAVLRLTSRGRLLGNQVFMRFI
jgi:oxygen-independent coproporphyrinogen-3 oxidase